MKRDIVWPLTLVLLIAGWAVGCASALARPVAPEPSPSTPVEVRRYVHAGHRCLAELDGSGNVVRTYAWGLDVHDDFGLGDGSGALLWLRDAATGKLHLACNDGQGNVAGLVDAATGQASAEYQYGPYGELLGISGSYAESNPIRYGTKRFEALGGFYDYGFRHYDPDAGRWLSRDPLGEIGGLNPYAFVGNDPASGIDYLGMFDFGAKYRQVTGVANDNVVGVTGGLGVGSAVALAWAAPYTGADESFAAAASWRINPFMATVGVGGLEGLADRLEADVRDNLDRNVQLLRCGASLDELDWEWSSKSDYALSAVQSAGFAVAAVGVGNRVGSFLNRIKGARHSAVRDATRLAAPGKGGGGTVLMDAGAITNIAARSRLTSSVRRAMESELRGMTLMTTRSALRESRIHLRHANFIQRWRYNRNLNRYNLVPENPSLRFQVQPSRRLGYHDLRIFGTADTMGLRTITTDGRFVTTFQNKFNTVLDASVYRPLSHGWFGR